mmetsp:Transcript_69310/g.115203  ORF Transcript_69310/g.115203 Transcript_69310/m.115203 type:complete len:212 (+) Transcript_69310:2-637(+)
MTLMVYQCMHALSSQVRWTYERITSFGRTGHGNKMPRPSDETPSPTNPSKRHPECPATKPCRALCHVHPTECLCLSLSKCCTHLPSGAFLTERRRTTFPSLQRVETATPCESCTLCFAPTKSAKSTSCLSGKVPQVPSPHGVLSLPFGKKEKPRTPPQAYGEPPITVFATAASAAALRHERLTSHGVLARVELSVTSARGSSMSAFDSPSW